MLNQRRPVEMLRERRLKRELQELQEHHQALQRAAQAQASQDVAALAAASRTTALPTSARFVSAAGVWMSMTFLLCYLAIPMGRMALGLGDLNEYSVMGTALSGAAGLMGTMVVLTGLLAVTRPAVQVDVDPDRILAATSGSLLVWGLLHNILPGLVMFSQMGLGELASFGLSNVLESALFGVVLASVARSGRAAFSLGVLFQALLFGLSYMAMVMLF